MAPSVVLMEAGGLGATSGLVMGWDEEDHDIIMKEGNQNHN